MWTFAVVAVLAGFGPEPLLPGSPWVLKGHGDTLTAVTFSPDSKRLASAARDKTVKVWDLQTGEPLQTLTVGQNQISALAFSADGKRLAVGDAALQAMVIDLSTGAVVKTIAHPDAVGEVALSPDGATLVIAGLTDHAAAWDVATEKKLFTFKGRTARFSADGKVLLTASSAGRFVVLDPKTGKVKKQVNDDSPLATMTPDGKTIATWTVGSLDVRLWSADGKALATLKGPVAEMDRRKARLTGVGVLPDGKRVVTSAADGVVRLWSVETAKVTQTWPADKNTGLAVSPDGAWVAVLDSGLVKLWKLP